jgi:hypothetical protein
MRFDCNVRGEWLVDPGELADKLRLSPARLMEEQRLGLVRTRVENGRESDAGCSRVTVQSRGAVWQGVFDPKGALISERSDSD